MVGRSIDQVFPKREVTLGPIVLEANDLVQRDRIRRSLVPASRGRDHRPLWPCRRRPLGGDAGLFGLGALTRGTVRIDGKRSTSARPSDAIRAGARLRPGGPPDPGRRASVRHPRQHDARLARRRCTTTASCPDAKELSDDPAPRRAARGQGGELGAGAGRIVGRQPAEGRHRQMARLGSAHSHSRRADQGHRHRLQGGGARIHGRTCRAKGLAILLVSSELPEVMGMADTILVMHEGKIVQALRARRGDGGNDRQRRHRRRGSGVAA